MDKLYTILSNLWTTYVMDTIPEHVDKAIHWVCFGFYMIILLAAPLLVWGAFLLIRAVFGGKRDYD